MSYTKRCPQCGNEISWLQKWRFTTPYATRRVRPCPHCGIRLRWSRVPWYVINGAVIGLFVILFLEIGFDITTNGSFLLLFCGVNITMAIAASFLQFEVVEPDGGKGAEATLPEHTSQYHDSDK